MMKAKRFAALFLLMLMAFVCIACTLTPQTPSDKTEPEQPSGTDQPENPTQSDPADNTDHSPDTKIWTLESFPKIDGSTATIPLGQAVVATLTGITREQAAPYAEFSGTSRAYERLVNKEVDVLIVYEGAMSTLEDKLDKIEMVPIGRDALVFLINKQNPTENLTADQIVSIYSGEITNWKELGGEDKKIIAYQRGETSGSQAMMQKLVMKDKEMAKAPAELVLAEMGGLVDAVAAYRDTDLAIGYNVFYYVTQMKNDANVKLLSIDGIVPSSESIGKGQYPFVNEFYAVIRKEAAEDSPERKLFDWLQSDEAKELMEKEDYVSIKE